MKKTYADECLERAEKATEGPWESSCDNVATSDFHICATYNNDEEFIAHARTDVPELAKRLKIALKELRRAAYAIDNEDYASQFTSIVHELEAPLDKS